MPRGRAERAGSKRAEKKNDAASKGGVSRLGDEVGDVVGLVIDYAKQETLGPFQTLPRYAMFAAPGAVLFTGGSVLLLLGFLRALQTETGMTGHLSWLPYVLTLVAALIIAAATGLVIWRGAQRKRSS